MKKSINVVLAVLLPVAIVIAGGVADWSVGGGTAKLVESSGAITLTVDKVAATTQTVASKTPVVSDSATTISMLQSGVKAATGASVTQAFATVYSTEPVVIYRYTGVNMPATNPVTITVSNFIVAAAQTNFNWIAVGVK